MLDPQPPTPAPAQVLVVDDEETVRNLLSLIVSRAGAKADLAVTGKEAKALLDERRYACALLDKNLPDMTGIQLMAHIKAQSPRTECLIVTGYASTESAIEAVRLGAFDYIVKPFDVVTVQHRVKLAIERQRLQAELERSMAALERRGAELAESREEVRRAYMEAVTRLARAVEYKDDAAPAHVARIARYAAILARALDARPEWVEMLACAAPLHDIGKVGVPDVILHKPGPLTTDEQQAAREHVAIGARILDGATSDLMALAREVVLTHHERWDGSGYPAGLAGQAIPLSGRIVAVCDAWDAVSTDRVYRRALPFAAAVEEITRHAGTFYDPQVIEAFTASIDKFRAVLEQSA